MLARQLHAQARATVAAAAWQTVNLSKGLPARPGRRRLSTQPRPAFQPQAGVVSEILPMFEQRKVQHFVVETKPYAWHTKDILPAAGRELFARLAEISQEVYELESNTKVASPAALRELLKVRSDHNLAFKFFD